MRWPPQKRRSGDASPAWRGARSLGASLVVLAAIGCDSATDAGPQSVPSGSGTILALSYNVAGLPDALSGSNPDVNTAMISPLLNEFDLVVVQEDWLTPDDYTGAFEVYHDRLAAEAEHPYQSVPASSPLGQDPDRPEAQLGDGLNRFSNSPFGEVTRVAWDGCFGGLLPTDGGAGDCLAIKGFSVATHELSPGIEVDVYNLHGEAGGTEMDQALQQTGYADLAEFILAHSEGRAILMGGDTNLHTDDGHADGMGSADAIIWNDLEDATGLSDVCDVIDPCEDAIDKFAFRSDGGLILEALSHEFQRQKFSRPDGEPLSDHPPLVVEFAWSTE